MNKPVLWLVCALFHLTSLTAIGQDTGPEYLESAGENEQNPITSGIDQLNSSFDLTQETVLHLRSFYMDRSRQGSINQHDWAAGGWLKGTTSLWQSRIKVSATAYTSQKVWADDDALTSGALQPEQNSYSVVGELYAALALEDVAVQAGRYVLNLPYFNAADTRMTPQSFEGMQVAYTPTENWTFGVGRFDQIKKRTREGFDPLYSAPGLDEEEPVSIAVAIRESGPGNFLGAYAMHAPKYLNGTYIEGSRRHQFAANRYLQVSAQYTYMTSTGREIGGDFTATHYGLRTTWKHDWLSGSLAYTDYPKKDHLRSEWGSIPGYTSIMISDFDRPEETAWLVGGTLELDRLAPGVSVNAKAVIGDTPDCGVSASPDRDEYNLNINYKPLQTRWSDLRLQLRFAHIERSGTCENRSTGDIDEIRFVFNLPLSF